MFGSMELAEVNRYAVLWKEYTDEVLSPKPMPFRALMNGFVERGVDETDKGKREEFLCLSLMGLNCSGLQGF